MYCQRQINDRKSVYWFFHTVFVATLIFFFFCSRTFIYRRNTKKETFFFSTSFIVINKTKNKAVEIHENLPETGQDDGRRGGSVTNMKKEKKKAHRSLKFLVLTINSEFKFYKRC